MSYNIPTKYIYSFVLVILRQGSDNYPSILTNTKRNYESFVILKLNTISSEYSGMVTSTTVLILITILSVPISLENFLKMNKTNMKNQ